MSRRAASFESWPGGGRIAATPIVAEELPSPFFVAPGRIILAPSGSGKTHHARMSPNVFADGDDIIHLTTGWPASHSWAESDAATEISARNWACVAAAAIARPDRCFLFNGRPFSSPNIRAAVLLLDVEQHRRQISLRAADPSNTNWVPSDDELIRNRRWMLELAISTALPLFLTWEAATAWAVKTSSSDT